MEKNLNELKAGEAGEIVSLEGGKKFKIQLRSRGLRKGQIISVLTRQPGGPLVINSGRSQLTLGRGMAKKIIVRTEE